MVKLIQVFFSFCWLILPLLTHTQFRGTQIFLCLVFIILLLLLLFLFGNILITEMCTHLEWCRLTFMCTCEMQSQRAANTFRRFSYSPSKWHNQVPIKSYLAWRKKITIYIARFGPQLTTILKNNTDESLMSTILFPSDVNVSLFSGSEL